MHGAGLVHGDLKGVNVLVSDDGHAMLTDFGNARILDSALLSFASSSTSGVAISLRWAAPEMLSGVSGYTMPADVYSLGMEIVTGDVPYSEIEYEAGVMTRVYHRRKPVQPIWCIPPKQKWGMMLWALLNKCWEYDPPGRPSATQVLTSMKKILELRLLLVGSASITETRVEIEREGVLALEDVGE
ncbi:hypothetical protein FRC12_015567 [Ceratobasidium sp. 428]|nr:hypothetical protein FRC12_015567 [Ceratobasidium sp. 428]